MKKLLATVLVCVFFVLSVGCSESNFETAYSEPELTIEELCESGNYNEAYQKAAEGEKRNIWIENQVAALCVEAIDGLKDPTSFQLRKAYCNSGDTGIVLQILATNGFGAKVTSYYLYIWDNDEANWSYYCSVSDLADDEYKSYDDTEDRLEKALKNVGRSMMRNAINNGVELSKDAIKRINKHFEEDTLDDIDLLDHNMSSETVTY